MAALLQHLGIGWLCDVVSNRMVACCVGVWFSAMACGAASLLCSSTGFSFARLSAASREVAEVLFLLARLSYDRKY
ncbi:hypothetical protein BJX64DRAFT_187793 [Aspergillus heterothallicus]